MNKEREEILRQIHNTDIKDLRKNIPKPSKWKIVKEIALDFIFLPFKFVWAFLAGTKENIGSGSAHMSGHSNQSHQSSEGSTFKDSVSFDPSQAYMERIQERAYFSMIDGKGDHDCDHEH